MNHLLNKLGLYCCLHVAYDYAANVLIFFFYLSIQTHCKIQQSIETIQHSKSSNRIHILLVNTEIAVYFDL